MSHFAYRDGIWHCEDVPVPRIAEEAGTPFYVYSKNALLENYKAMDAAFGDMPHTICYALKANSNLSVNRVLSGAGCGAEVVSGGELFRALKAGYSPDKIVFDGNAKTVAEMRQALEAGICAINVDSENELRVLEQTAKQMGLRARIGLRVNPDVNPETHPKIATGLKTTKFGVDLTKAIACYEHASKSSHLQVVGIQTHIGSQILKVDPFAEAFGKLVDIALSLREKGIGIEFIDIGGGLGIQYNEEAPPTYEAYMAALRPHWERCPVRIITEPGRRMVGNVGNLVTRVLYVKESPVKRFVVVDGAMNDLWRPSMYDAYHGVVAVRETRERFTADVVGGICESGDYFARDRDMGVVQPGEFIAIQSGGAYSSSMSSEYNSRPLVPEVLVDGDQFSVVRRRPSYEEMLRLEM